MKLAWWPHTTDGTVASYRIRCRLIVDALRARGIDCGLWTPGDKPPSVLVLSKRYDQSSLETALTLRHERGTRLVLDLCDNHFYAQAPDGYSLQRAANLRGAVSNVDLVVASTDALKAAVEQEAPSAPLVEVIGDAAEPPTDGSTDRTVLGRSAGELELWWLKRALRKDGVSAARRAVWFGNHGSPNTEGGMSDLIRIRSALVEEAKRAPVSLTVISNNRSKFKLLMAGWPTPCHYLPWRQSTFTSALRLHALAVLPIGINPFTQCKTNNRVATALLHGLAVVADRIPSYEEFSGSVFLGDWGNSLGLAMAGSDSLRQAIDRGAGVVQSRYSVSAIAQRWLDVLLPARECPKFCV
jgi:hypothetical protein